MVLLWGRTICGLLFASVPCKKGGRDGTVVCRIYVSCYCGDDREDLWAVSHVSCRSAAVCDDMSGSRIYGQASCPSDTAGTAEAAHYFSGIWLTASVLFLLYTLNCGINYQRKSFSEQEGIVTEAYSVEELQRVCEILTQDVNTYAEQVERDGDGLMVLDGLERELAVEAMHSLGESYEGMAGFYPEPKALAGSWLLSVQNLSGIYAPFTVEANYNNDMTDYNIPFTACHELSHLRGFMQEEEANFIAYLACMESDVPEFRYSGSLLGWIHCTNALRREDIAAWKEVREQLSEKVLADLQANSEFWSSYEGKVSEVSEQINDHYLKANGQSDGVKSYGRMVDLLAAYLKER